jgi:hypothetical protein
VWQGPLALGSGGTLQNSQCTVSGSGSSATGSGNNLTVSLALGFKSSFAGAKNTYMQVAGTGGDSGWQQKGTWTVLASLLPTAVSVSPASGSSSSSTFVFTYSDPSGYSSIATAQILFSSGFSTPGSCFLYFNRAANTLYLTNDAATAWQTPVTLGTSATLENSQCSVNAASSSSSGSGNTLTLSLKISFRAAFSGAKNVYTLVANGAGNSGWQQRGTWTVP